jgi:hypothetical protein
VVRRNKKNVDRVGKIRAVDLEKSVKEGKEGQRSGNSKTNDTEGWGDSNTTKHRAL